MRASIESSRSGVGLDGDSPKVGCGGGGEWMTAQHLPGDRPGDQNEPDTLEALPRPRVHCQSHTLPQVMVHPVCHA